MTQIRIAHGRCTACGLCSATCPLELFDFNEYDPPELIERAEEFCIGCGHCMAVCPEGAISLDQVDPDQCEKAVDLRPESFQQFSALVKSRRSIRKYDPRSLEDETLDRLFDLVRWAPSAKNQQVVQWIVVNRREKVHELSARVASYMKTYGLLPMLVEAWEKGHDVVHRDAPCLAIAHAPDDAWVPAIDCTIATELLDLAAFSLGLGSCWAGFFMTAARNDRSLSDFLEIPKGHSIHTALMLGYPQEHYVRVPPRREARVRRIS